MTFADCFLTTFHPDVDLLRDIKPHHLENYKRRRLGGEIHEPERREDVERERTLREELRRCPQSDTHKANAKYGWLGRKKLHRDVTKTTINYEIQTLKTFFKWCIKQNYLFIHPGEIVEKFRVPKRSVPKFMTSEELDRFFAACRPEEQGVFSILLLTGMRRGELVNLEWADIDLSLGVIFVRAKRDWEPKTDERLIPVSPTLHQVLIEQYEFRRSDRWVVANRHGNRETHLLEKLKKVCRRAGIQPAAATLHALRHSFGAHLRMSGVPLANIADLMGHKDLATTQIYAKVQMEHLREAIGRLTPLVPTQMSLKNVTQLQSAGRRERKALGKEDLEEPETDLAGRQGFEAHATSWRSLRDDVVFWQARASARLAGARIPTYR